MNRVWQLGKKGELSVKISYDQLTSCGEGSDCVTFLWKIKAPATVVVFCGIAVLSKIFIVNHLYRRNNKLHFIDNIIYAHNLMIGDDGQSFYRQGTSWTGPSLAWRELGSPWAGFRRT